MGKVRAFLKRKDIEISAKRYGIDALSAMAQGLSGAEMNLLASLMQKPQMLGEARQAIADYSRQIRTQKWKREMTKDRDILSFAIEKNGRNPNE